MASKKTRKGYTLKQKKKIALATKNKRSKGKFRSFEDAREFVAQLGLQTMTDWFRFSRSGTMPPDIPKDPDHVYGKESGTKEWTGWTDWLGKPYSDGTPYVTGAQLVKAYPDAIRKTKDGVEILQMKYLRGKKGRGMEQLRNLSREIAKSYTIGETKKQKLENASTLHQKNRYEESLAITSELVKSIDFSASNIEYTSNEKEAMNVHRHNLIKLKSYQDALKFSVELAKSDYEGVSLFNLGICYYRLGRFEESITTYLSAIEKNPSMIEFWYNLACSYACLKEAKKACNALLISIACTRDHNAKILAAKTDPDFDAIRNDPGFKKIVSSHWRDLF